MKRAKPIAVMFLLLAAATVAVGLIQPQIFLRQATDLYLHDTYYVVSHSLVFLVLGLFFAACGIVYLFYEKAVHRTMSMSLGHLHFWLSLGSIAMLFYAMREIPQGNPGSDAVLQSEFHTAAELAFAGFFGFLAAQIVFAVNVVSSFFRGKNP